MATRFPRILGLLALASITTGGVTTMPQAQGATPVAAVGALTQEEAHAIAVDAYVYGYPLVTMEMTRRVMTNATTDNGKHAPMGQWAKMRTYPTAEDMDVTAPDADTLYTMAWLDLSKEPYVVTTPDMKGRFFLLPLLGAWTNVFAAPGTRTTAPGPVKFVITGPGWKGGALPAGVTQYQSPTNLVWILGRIYSSGTPQDLDAVHAVQDQMQLVPVSAYGKPYTPPAGVVDPAIDMKTPVRNQVNALDAQSFFKIMSQVLVQNPPAAADRPMVDQMAKIGIVPGRVFDPGKLSPAVVAALQGVPQEARDKIKAHVKNGGVTHQNGWMVTLETGRYGTAYLQRAFVAAVGLGANLPQDAVYPVSIQDAMGQPYDGGHHKYVLHFDKDKKPPVRGFWSLTMYDENMFFTPNTLNRYDVSSRMPFKTNADGSTDIYVQNDSPGPDKEANWLPAPAGKFALMLRLYWPDEKAPTILDGSWKPPGVSPVQ
jgi:hypothetical protein